MRVSVLGLILALTCGAVQAQERGAAANESCRFDWPLTREEAWFAASDLPRIASGGMLSVTSPAAMVALLPVAEAKLPNRPTREPKPGTFAGVITVAAPTTSGLYQVTLSDEGWIDVFQEGEEVRRPVSHTGQRACPGLRKSLRFQLTSKPVSIIVSNASAETVKLAVTLAE